MDIVHPMSSWFLSPLLSLPTIQTFNAKLPTSAHGLLGIGSVRGRILVPIVPQEQDKSFHGILIAKISVRYMQNFYTQIITEIRTSLKLSGKHCLQNTLRYARLTV